LHLGGHQVVVSQARRRKDRAIWGKSTGQNSWRIESRPSIKEGFWVPATGSKEKLELRGQADFGARLVKRVFVLGRY